MCFFFKYGCGNLQYNVIFEVRYFIVGWVMLLVCRPRFCQFSLCSLSASLSFTLKVSTGKRHGRPWTRIFSAYSRSKWNFSNYTVN